MDGMLKILYDIINFSARTNNYSIPSDIYDILQNAATLPADEKGGWFFKSAKHRFSSIYPIVYFPMQVNQMKMPSIEGNTALMLMLKLLYDRKDHMSKIKRQLH